MKKNQPRIEYCKNCDCLRGGEDSGYPCPEGEHHVWTSTSALPSPQQGSPLNF
ncbi:hypothetical protein SEA_TEATEALATTE_38 [Gordonia phage Teatealatte]|uniref:Uncharacterized protein n=2 Tax=Demosthenesvirus katyusha TaxID=1982108 RepID=A0A345MCG9_9CAUD|nr:hypothetical protein SEA_TEATEALATTE_38 [Gordonia phage Teatealatte]QBP29596.1 hypothetical protein SEA_TREDGE_38 [Gordonia phage Tredge]